MRPLYSSKNNNSFYSPWVFCYRNCLCFRSRSCSWHKGKCEFPLALTFTPSALCFGFLFGEVYSLEYELKDCKTVSSSLYSRIWLNGREVFGWGKSCVQAVHVRWVWKRQLFSSMTPETLNLSRWSKKMYLQHVGCDFKLRTCMNVNNTK